MKRPNIRETFMSSVRSVAIPAVLSVSTMFSSAKAQTVIAGNGTDENPTYNIPATQSPLPDPYTLARKSGGDILVGTDGRIAEYNQDDQTLEHYRNTGSNDADDGNGRFMTLDNQGNLYTIDPYKRYSEKRPFVCQ